MQKLFLPFRPPVGLPSGYKCEVWGSVFPLQAICVSALLLFVSPSAALHRHSHFFLCRRRTPFPTTMAGKSQILPTDAWARSTVTERKLEELVHDGLLWPRASRTQPEWRVLPSNPGSRRPRRDMW
jgi:hypothetical protein